MKQKHEFKSIVAETLLIPLYMRAKESHRDNPILNDKTAERLADNLEYDYSKFDGAKLSEVGCVVRGWYFDPRTTGQCLYSGILAGNRLDGRLASEASPFGIYFYCGRSSDVFL